MNSSLLPITITEFGIMRSLFMCFLFGTNPMLVPSLHGPPNAKKAAQLAYSKLLPCVILLVCANDVWILRHGHPDEFYGYSYRAMDPRIYSLLSRLHHINHYFHQSQVRYIVIFIILISIVPC